MSAEQTAIEAEQALLGAMMLSPAALWAALDIVTPSDFLDPKHEIISNAMGGLVREKQPVDVITLSDELLRRGDAQRVPIDYLHTLTSKPTTATLAPHYAEVVVRHAALRRTSRAAAVLSQGISEGRDVLALADEARALLDGVADTHATIEKIGTVFDELSDELEHPPVYLPTPWAPLNNYLHGLMPGALYVIAARPGAGKTISGLQLARAFADRGPVVFHSLEMPRKQLLRRLIASEATVSLTTLMKHTLSPDDWHKVVPARSKILDLPLYIDDRSGVSMTQIESYARQVARTGQLQGLVVDYLQLIPSRDSRKPRWEHIGDLTRGFKLLAKDLNVPVILLSQLNRESEKNRRLPMLSDLRESGSVEQDADVVLMLQRQADANDEPTDILDVVIAKNRHGQQGRVELGWEGRYSRLTTLRWGTPTVDWKAKQAGDDR